MTTGRDRGWETITNLVVVRVRPTASSRVTVTLRTDRHGSYEAGVVPPQHACGQRAELQAGEIVVLERESASRAHVLLRPPCGCPYRVLSFTPL